MLTLLFSALSIGIPIPIWLGLVQILPTWQATPLIGLNSPVLVDLIQETRAVADKLVCQRLIDAWAL
jgi:hypothetical protein